MGRRVRLKKVLVQPIFEIDDGENLEDVEYVVDEEGNKSYDHPVVVVSATEWPTYATKRFAAEVAAWQQKLDEEDAQAQEPPLPNRAQRRAAGQRNKPRRKPPTRKA